MALSKAEKLKIQEIAEKNGLDFDVVKKIIESPYQFIREKTKAIEFSDNLSEKEFDKIKTNFNLPGFAKMYASYALYSKIQENKNKKSLDNK